MLCSRCGKNAAKKYILQEKEVFLCDNCRPQGRGKASVCPECGTALSDFRRTGLLGCPYCYNAFRDEVIAMLDKMQGGTYHAGKVQSERSREKYEATHELALEHEYVKAELERAMLNRDYKTAESLQKKLRELHAKLYAEGDRE